MKIQSVDEMEFRGYTEFPGRKDPTQKYARIVFEEPDGHQIVFLENCATTPIPYTTFKRGALYTLICNVYGTRDGFSCRLESAQPYMLDD